MISDERIGKQLDRIEGKVDRLDNRADAVDVRLERYNAQLEIHVKRSDTLELVVQPIIQATQFVKTGAKVGAWIAGGLTGLAAVLVSLSKILGYF
jgi:hypothetical protein